MGSSAGKRAGQQFGNYHLLHLLAQNPFAEVYLGEHIFLKTQAAIKVVQVELTGEELERFLAEVRVMARLKDPHIIRVLEFGVQAEQPFLVMDYTSTNSLRQLHPQGSILPPATILGYVRQIAPALQCVHDEGLLHLNLRPETILLGPRKQLLLSDSSTGVLDQRAIPTHILPAPDQGVDEIVDYRAPEQLQGEPCAASDQYALAAMVYEWLSGQPLRAPSRGATLPGERRDQLLSAPMQSLREAAPSIPSDVKQAVLKALATEPEQRFATVGDFAHALEEALRLAIEPIKMAPERPEQPARKRSVPMIIALTALAVVVGASTLLSFRAFLSSGPPLQVAATSIAQAQLTTVDARFAGQSTQDIYLRVTSAHPIINDPLRQQAGSAWKDKQSGTFGSCMFAGGAYHVVSHVHEQVCLSASGNFSNFALQVRMTIIKGDYAGIRFRSNGSGTTLKFYNFVLNANGAYEPYELDVVGTRSNPLLASGSSPIIKTILNQPYLVTVIAVGSHFYFYLNTQYITDVIDPNNTLTSGQIGLMAGSDGSSATEAVFSDVEVWNL